MRILIHRGIYFTAALEYVCPACGSRFSVDSWLWRCPRCGSPLDLIGEGPLRRIGLGEGGTPCIWSERLGAMVKLEYLNPTGSFKDRGSSVAVGMARHMGYSYVSEDSSGNAGISVAAYSSAAGMEATIVVPGAAGGPKKDVIRALGARLLEAETREDAARIAQGMDECAYVGHMYSPFFVYGMEEFARELRSCPSNPDAVVMPVASGTLLLGAYRGAERSDMSVRLIAAQARGRAPLHEVLHGRDEGPPSSLADALLVRNPPRLGQMVDAIRRTGGDSASVGDAEIIKALRDLVRAGFLVEPSSAAALAAYRSLLDSGSVSRSERVVLVLTGSGLKYGSALGELLGRAGDA